MCRIYQKRVVSLKLDISLNFKLKWSLTTGKYLDLGCWKVLQFGRWSLIGGTFLLQIVHARKSGRKGQVLVKHEGHKTQILLYIECLLVWQRFKFYFPFDSFFFLCFFSFDINYLSCLFILCCLTIL